MSRKSAHEPIVEALVTHAMIQPRIAHALAGAIASDHAGTMRCFDNAIAQTTELKTRLEILQLEFAAASKPATGEEKAA